LASARVRKFVPATRANTVSFRAGQLQYAIGFFHFSASFHDNAHTAAFAAPALDEGTCHPSRQYRAFPAKVRSDFALDNATKQEIERFQTPFSWNCSGPHPVAGSNLSCIMHP